MTPHGADIFVGLMSGTSLDGVDGVVVEFPPIGTPKLFGTHYRPYPAELKTRLLDLHQAQSDELHLANILANELANLYSNVVNEMLGKTDLAKTQIAAIGCHGQTIRHRPESGYTVQLVNGARLAEQTGVTSIIDFRNRDIAAGGQGAPLVPAFHAAMLSTAQEHRVIVNIGGIANLTNLPVNGQVTGFDCGPGNMLMDAWVLRHLGKQVDDSGVWAATGKVLPELLGRMLAHDFFNAAPPKSAGREQFNMGWLHGLLEGNEVPENVQATLLELTAAGIVKAAQTYCKGFDSLYVCGGGVHNSTLMKRLSELAGKPVHSTARLGIDPDWMEAMAFAWLARQCLENKPGNLPAVTGASGPRILGAIYPS